MSFCVYVLHSEKLNRFYIGYTSNFEQRLDFHRTSASHKFTYSGGDWREFLKIECKSKLQAIKIESHIKKMKSKIYIHNLRRYPEMQEKLLKKYDQSSPR